MVKLIWTKSLWKILYSELRKRGGGETESGAFLLGKEGNKIIEDILYYDDLEPGCFDSGSIHLTFKSFIQLADYCSVNNLTVKADIHTHPFHVTGQSKTDKENPMIKIRGHIALIVPHFAMPERCDMSNLGIHEYLGNGYNWKSYKYNDGVIKEI